MNPLYTFFWHSGLSEMIRKTFFRKCCFVLNFHGVSSSRRTALPENVQPYFSIDELRETLTWLQDRFEFLTPADFLQTNHSGVLLTFDDGLANNYTNALPALEEFKAPAVFFVTTQHVSAPRNWLLDKRTIARTYWGDEYNVPDEIARDFFDGLSVQQLVDCAQNPLVTIGSHTVSHPFLTRCSDDNLHFELFESKRFLEDVTGKRVDMFAYPAGDYNRTVAEAVREAGYVVAFAVNSLSLGMTEFEIPRVDLYSADPAYLGLKLCGLHKRPLKSRALLNQ